MSLAALYPPDPDEFDAAPICNVCGAEVGAKILVHRPMLAHSPRNGRFTRADNAPIENLDRTRDPSRPIVCPACRVKGWRGRWCACGAVLHKRDYRLKACGKCRAEMNPQRTWHDAPI